MLGLTLRSLRANATRLLLSSLAIVLGVGFVTGTLIFSDGLTEATRERAGLLDRHTDVELTRAPSGDGVAPGFPPALVDRIGRVARVAAAEGTVAGSGVGVAGPGGESVPGFHVLFTVPASEAVRSLAVTAGRAPQRPGELVLDGRTAEQRGFQPGDELRLGVAERSPATYRLVGVVDVVGTSIDAGGAVIGMLLPDAQRLTGRTALDRIVIAAEPGVDHAELAERVRAEAGEDAVTRTGAELRAAALDDAVGNGDQFTEALLVFALIAVFVAAFVIANTFTILLAQRTREAALLRLVGATRGQLFRATMAESVALGVAGSLLGLLAGAGAAIGLRALYAMLGSGLPSGLVWQPRTVLVALLCGTGVTVGAALLPAWRGTRVPPVAALTDTSLHAARPPGRVRLAAGGLLLAVGAAALAGAGSTGSFLPVVAGGMVTFLGLVLAGPLVVPLATRAVGAPVVRLVGATAGLAVANAVRNPRRIAATAMALVIGIGLVTTFVVSARSLKLGVEQEVDARVGADFVVTSGADPVPPELVERLRQRPELELVDPHGDDDPWLVQLDPAGGVTAAAARSVVEPIVVDYPTVQFLDQAAYKAAQTSTVDLVLSFVTALLGLAVLISLLGLANTLTLSVVERTREHALLRAVGLGRGQLRAMLATEAVLMAVVGALCGITIGVAGAASAMAVLNRENGGDMFTVVLPWGQLGALVAVATAAALAASVLPARHAAGQPVVESLAAE